MFVCNDADFNDMITHCFSTGTCSFRRKDAGVNQRRAQGGCYLSEAAASRRVMGLGHSAVVWAGAVCCSLGCSAGIGRSLAPTQLDPTVSLLWSAPRHSG